MSAFVPPLAAEAVSAPSTSVYVGGIPIIALIALVILVVGKQTSVNVSNPRYARLSRCLDVGVIPLGITALAIAAHEVSRILA